MSQRYFSKCAWVTFIVSQFAGIYAKAKLTATFLKWKMEEYERIKKEIEELEEDVNQAS